MPFNFLKKLGNDAANRFSGKTDLLEAVCAGAALVAYADGNCSDDEVATALSSVKDHPGLSAAFDDRTIENTLETIFGRAKNSRISRAGLYKEIEDVANNAESADVVMMAVLDVADNNGIEEQEMAVLRTIASKLRVNLSNYLGS